MRKQDLQDLSWYRGHVTDVSRNRHDDLLSVVVKVSIKYDDEDEEIIENMEKQKWRMIYGHPCVPEVHWEVNSEMCNAHFSCMKKANCMVNDGNEKSVLVVCGRCPVTAEDYCSLQDGRWLSETIIEAFAKSLLSKSVNGNDYRFMFLSSQAFALIQSKDAGSRESLHRWLDGIELHDVDIILFPICHDNHWLLVAAYPAAHTAVLLDPFRPLSSKPGHSIIGSDVLQCLEELCKEYKKKYEDDRKWSLTNSKVAALQLNLPKQPAGNGSDCGVLICLYMWSYIVGMAWPPPTPESGSKSEEADKKSFAQLMSDARVNIGSHIATNGVIV